MAIAERPVRTAQWTPASMAREDFSPQYQELKFAIHRKLLERVKLDTLSALGEERMRREVRAVVAKLIEEERTPLSLIEKDRIADEVLDEVFGLGPLEPLLKDPTISDILVTTPKLTYIERAGKLVRVPVEFKDDAHMIRIIERIVSRVGRRIDESTVNAVIPPVAVDGPLLSIRRFGRDPLEAEDLIRMMTLTEEMIEFLAACVRARLNIIVTGGTGAGKTTLLNILSKHIPADERIVTIEDAAELQLRQIHGGPDGIPPREHRGQGRHQDPAARDQRPPHEARPHHRR